MARTDVDMTQGSIWKHLVRFALPMMLGLVFQQLYNAVDSIVVGQFVSRQALAAVGSTGSILNTMIGLSTGLAMGSTVTISQSYGAHDYERLHKAVHTTMMLTVILSVIMTAAGLMLVGPLLQMMDTPQDVLPEASAYLRVILSGISGLLFYNMGSGILRAVGDSKRPLYFLILSAILNVVFDLLFVVVFQMGVAGVAYATILSQFISAGLVVLILCRETGPYRVQLHKVRLHLPVLKKILAIGLPTAVQLVLTNFSNVFVQSYINFFGSAAMAGWSSYNKVDAFLTIPMQAISMASTTFVGQNFGAKNLARARQGVKQSAILAASVTLAMALIIMLLAGPAIRLFSADPEVIELGVHFVLLISPFYTFICINQVLAGTLRGVDNARIPMVLLLFSYVFFRQAYLFVARLLGNHLSAIAFSYPMGWICALILLLIAYRRSVLFREKA